MKKQQKRQGPKSLLNGKGSLSRRFQSGYTRKTSASLVEVAPDERKRFTSIYSDGQSCFIFSISSSENIPNKFDLFYQTAPTCRPMLFTAGTEIPESPELQALLTAATKDHPGRVSGARALLAGLRRLTLVAAEEWQAVLHAAVVEIRRRLVTLKMEAARIRDVAAGDDASRVVLWQRRYSTLLHNVTANLQGLLQVRL